MKQDGKEKCLTTDLHGLTQIGKRDEVSNHAPAKHNVGQEAAEKRKSGNYVSAFLECSVNHSAISSIFVSVEAILKVNRSSSMLDAVSM